jgi:hypothetical protein
MLQSLSLRLQNKHDGLGVIPTLNVSLIRALPPALTVQRFWGQIFCESFFRASANVTLQRRIDHATDLATKSFPVKQRDVREFSTKIMD